MNLYGSLFDNPERHLDIVKELAKHPQGRTRTQLLKSYKSGGRLSRTLFELEEASFITAHEPFGGKRSGAVYRLTDEYYLFYLKWIEGERDFWAERFFQHRDLLMESLERIRP